MNSRLSTPESNALAVICREWYVSFGAITLAVVLSLWIHPLWMPVYELLLAVLLALFGPGRKINGTEPCGRITLITVYTLLFTALISFGINVAYHTELIHAIFDISTLNHSIPYVTSLVIFPVCLVLTAFLNSRRVFAHHVRTCHLHNHYNPSQPVFGRMVHATYRSLLKRLLVISAIISVIDWTYYFLCYRNNAINTPDSFFFFVVPAAIYVWSLIYVGHAYSMLAMSNGRTVTADASAPVTPVNTLTDSVVVRFLVLKGDALLLDVTEGAVRDCNVDTPVVEIRGASYKGDVGMARADFQQRYGIERISVKLLYTNVNKLYNNTFYHFLVRLDDGDDARADLLPGTWVTLDGVDRMMRAGIVAPPLADEFFRIYTMAMAWKTYYRDGRRRFPIKNYQPNFRLNDLYDYDVDYNDLHWLKVSRINQDKRMWPLRRFSLRSRDDGQGTT